MKVALLLTLTIFLGGCGQVTVTTGSSVTDKELEGFFKQHKVDGNVAVALKKHTVGAPDSYLATIHGYPDNLSVCKSLVEPYNNDAKLSVIPGSYFCEELR